MRLYVRFAVVLTALALAACGLVLSDAAQSQPPAAAPAVIVGGVTLGAPAAVD